MCSLTFTVPPLFPYPAECIKFQIYLCFSFVAASSAGPAYPPAYKMCFKLKNFAIFFAAFWKQQNLCRYFFNADSSRLSSSFQRLEVFSWFYFFFWRQVAIWQGVPIGLPLCRSLHSDRTVPVINIAPPSRFKLSTFLRASHRRFRSRIAAMQLGARMQMALQLTNASCRVLIWAVIK